MSKYNKDILGQIHRACFDYVDTEKIINDQSVENRIMECWDGVSMILKHWAEVDEKGFLDFIKNS